MICYRVDVAERAAHCYLVCLTLAAPAAQQGFSLPVWIPGSYMVREFSRHLHGLKARQNGRHVELRQVAKNRWRADCHGPAPLELRYTVYAFDTSVRAAYLDNARGFFNATSLCLQVEGRERERHAIELTGLPEDWQVATAMDRQDGHFEAADYDELVDHPFELGVFWRGEFEADGVPHQIVVSGALPVFDGERLLADARRICEAEIAFWGVAPFKRYVFLLNAVEDSYGGLEHRASTALIAARRDLPRLGQGEVSDGYVRLLGLISHEYFHAWNVKRLRPAEFAQLDYGRENPSELLWFFEGFTSYYDELLLARSGLIDAARYLKLLAGTINTVLGAPGRKVQSLAQSSFEAWTKYYRPDENTPNVVVSYYAKGALLGLALDLSLRAAGTASLDDVMRLLWARSAGGPVDEAAILAVIAELGGTPLAEDVRGWVHGCADLPLENLLGALGVRWQTESAPLAQRLGLRMAADAPLRVKSVLSASPALVAGLSAGDELIACNDWRLQSLDDVLTTLQPEAPRRLELLVSREQRVLRLTLCLPESEGARTVQLSAPDEVALRRTWLGG